MENKLGMIFGFNLYAIPLQVILVTYFRRELGELRGLEVLEGDEVCCCQYWKTVSVLVNFQNKASIV